MGEREIPPYDAEDTGKGRQGNTRIAASFSRPSDLKNEICWGRISRERERRRQRQRQRQRERGTCDRQLDKAIQRYRQ